MPQRIHWPYNQNQGMFTRQIGGTQKRGWPTHSPVPLRLKDIEASISADLEFDGDELKYTGDHKELTVGISIQPDGEIRVTSAPERITSLFQHFDPSSGIGVVDYIGPFRTFPFQKVQGLALNELTIEQGKNERIDLPSYGQQSNKFA